MMILEYNQYKKYLDDKEFMKYFNSLNDKVKELFPTFTLNLELIIDRIYCLYLEKYAVEDAINYLCYHGHLVTFTATNGDS